MKKSKIISRLSIIIFLISIFYTALNVTVPLKSQYKEGMNTITGKVISCSKKEWGTKLIVKAKEKIIVNYSDSFSCTLGKTVTIKGEIKKPSTFHNLNLFDYQKYLYSQKINYQMTAQTITQEKTKILWNWQIKNELIKKINTYKTKEYMHAFILGDTSQIEQEITTSYQNNGISHLLAISGMQITLLALIILFLLNLFSGYKKLNYLIVIMVLLFYTFLTSFTPSVTRATLLFIALTFNKHLNLKIKSIYLLILICAGFLFYNPYIIYNIGFLFSFIITFFLILSSEYLKTINNYILKTFIISLIAFIASLPILINNFHQINILSPFINIIYVPLISFIIYPISLVTLIIPNLDSILLILIKASENLSLMLSKITALTFVLKHLNLGFFILYYILVSYVIYTINKKKIKGLIILSLVILIHVNINYLNKYPTITMIDVKQGDCFLITIPHNKGNILIDTGGIVNYNDQETYDLAKNQIIPYLKSEGITSLDYLIITHGDFDHAGMATNLINSIKINNIILNPSSDNSLEKAIIKKAEQKNIKIEKAKEKTLQVNKYQFYFLSKNIKTNENDDSLIIYTKLNSKNILFMGDASEEREKRILSSYSLVNMDILKVGHHGSKTSTSKQLVSVTNPKISLISAGENNIYGHPHKETLNRLKRSKVLITSIDGSVKLTLKKRIIYQTAR